MLKWMTSGESHGAALIAVMEGLPSGLTITSATFERALARRRLGYGRGARQRFERDQCRIISGVRHGQTTGAPIAIEIANTEWPKWESIMSADPVDEALLQVDGGKGDVREKARNRPLTTPRPGHADLAGMVSYDLRDARDVLERASARETAARVALGALASEYLKQVADIRIVSRVVSIGGASAPAAPLPTPGDAMELDECDVRVLDESVAKSLRAEIDKAHSDGNTVGGVAEVVAWNVPLGLGSHISAQSRLDSRLAAALMSIQSVKAVEIGDGFEQASTFGSHAHDEIIWDDNGEVARLSNHAGGIEGGTTNGEPIVVRAGFKPISTVPRALQTVDLAARKEATAFHQRSDTCQVVPGAVIAEAMVALEIACALEDRIGSRSVAEATAHVKWLRAHISEWLSRGEQ